LEHPVSINKERRGKTQDPIKLHSPIFRVMEDGIGNPIVFNEPLNLLRCCPGIQRNSYEMEAILLMLLK